MMRSSHECRPQEEGGDEGPPPRTDEEEGLVIENEF